MEFDLDINKAINLTNKKTTTIDHLCKFLFESVRCYQDSREAFYLKEFKELSHTNFHLNELATADTIATEIAKKVERDVKRFIPIYVDESIDKVLDAVNYKLFKTKHTADCLLILLSTLKETYTTD